MKKTMMIALLAVTVFGCSTKDGSAPTKTVSPQSDTAVIKRVVSEASAQALVEQEKLKEASIVYADIAEILISSEGLNKSSEAKALLNKSLELDSENQKALLYNSLVAIAKPLEGSKKRGGIVGDEESHTFLKNEFIPAIDESVSCLDKLDSAEATKMMNTKLFQEIGLQDRANKPFCEKEDFGWICTELIDTNNNSVKHQIVMDDAVDLKILKGSVSAMGSSFRLMIAYKMDGLENLKKKLEELKNTDGPLTEEQVVQQISEQEDFLKLSDDHELDKVAASLEQNVEDMLDFETMQEEICPEGNRINNIFKSICLSQKDVERLSVAQKSLTGPIMIRLGKSQLDGQDIYIKMDASVLLNSSVDDLKIVLPTEFDEDGKITNENERTVGGIFPDGDLIEKLIAIIRK